MTAKLLLQVVTKETWNLHKRMGVGGREVRSQTRRNRVLKLAEYKTQSLLPRY